MAPWRRRIDDEGIVDETVGSSSSAQLLAAVKAEEPVVGNAAKAEVKEEADVVGCIATKTEEPADELDEEETAALLDQLCELDSDWAVQGDPYL